MQDNHQDPRELPDRYPQLDKLISRLLRSNEGQTLADLMQLREDACERGE